MTITYKKGCLLKALKEGEVDYILHQTNAQGKFNSGVAKLVREQFPKAYEAYMYDYSRLGSEGIFGTISKGSKVINMTSQYFYGYDGMRYTNYGALANCLSQVICNIKMFKALDENIKIGIPYKLSSDRGGADWVIVLELVEHLLGWADVYIYHLEEI